MKCACCGARVSGGYRQWFNQDTGWGLCAECPAFIQDPTRREPMDDGELERCYGRAGINRPHPTATPAAR